MGHDIRIVASLKVQPEAKEAIEAAVGTCAAASRREEGCLMYVGHWDESDPAHLVFIEHWASQAALDEHKTTPHYHVFIAAIADLLQGPPTLLTLHEIR